jgi:hypothetical protein
MAALLVGGLTFGKRRRMGYNGSVAVDVSRSAKARPWLAKGQASSMQCGHEPSIARVHPQVVVDLGYATTCSHRRLLRRSLCQKVFSGHHRRPRFGCSVCFWWAEG